jgi:4-hydroxy-tetrahydrodipicolinate synthase
MQLTGVFTALVTPFSAGEVDLPTFRALCERQVQAGVAGLVPCGTTGEAPTLSASEWSALVETTLEVARAHEAQTGQRVAVVPGVGTNSTASTVEAVQRARKLGADAGLLVLPYYNKPNPRGLLAHVERAASEGLPMVVYHVPGRTAQRLPLAQLARLCEVPGVVACKEATGDVAFGIDLVEALELHGGGVTVLSGDDFTFAPLVAMGGHGVISVLSNVAPRMTVAWCDAARTGDVATLRDLRRRLQPLVRFLFADSNPVPVKAAMAAMGLCADEPRLPLASGSRPDPELIRGLQ